ncbi:SHOCT domain-containing protein [Williamsia sterculiae]|uniref:SHOCT domain-containing protein n=1 Tax=Williamsia sterculiae TaxID=1344003 RepID=A0A1N7GGC5_9NOCA|nr:SHOCT domain-containing protein [Williamsia sterculiae]SIS11610.1 hypothetical protein SAMN05445060_2751 [Williamsia sterculiae]
MIQLSSKVKEKKSAKWQSVLAPDLYQGELIWAFTGASRMRPITMGMAITNARLIGFNDTGTSTEKRILVEVFADQIRDVQFTTKMGTTSLRVNTAIEEVNFGAIDASEVDFARYYVDYLASAGIAPEVTVGIKQRNDEQNERDQAASQRLRDRDNVQVFGTAMKDKWWDSIHRHSHDGELPWFVINSGMDGLLAAFEDRLLISKTGAMASWMAGSLGGGRETIFPYSDITNIEYNGGFMNGVLEVLTPSYQGTANHDFWRSSGKSRNSASDDPRTLSNCLPLLKSVYQQAQPRLNELHRKMAESKRPQVIVQQSAPATTAAEPAGIAAQIEKLADMHQRGLLDDDEFKAAKRGLIAKLG